MSAAPESTPDDPSTSNKCEHPSQVDASATVPVSSPPEHLICAACASGASRRHHGQCSQCRRFDASVNQKDMSVPVYGTPIDADARGLCADCVRDVDEAGGSPLRAQQVCMACVGAVVCAQCLFMLA